MAKSMAEFRRQVYTVVAGIPQGRVASYGQIATLAGFTGYARHVGKALAHLPEGSAIPWFRVLSSKGEIALKGADFERQKQALIADGVSVTPQGKVKLSQFGWSGEAQG